MMDINEINNQKWKVSKNLEILGLRTANISRGEQELHINIVAQGFEDSSKEEALICCSTPKYILKLSRNCNFTLQSVLKSEGLNEGNGRVLQITGKIYDTKRIVLRLKKKTQLSEEEKKIRIERLAKAREKRKNDR